MDNIGIILMKEEETDKEKEFLTGSLI